MIANRINEIDEKIKGLQELEELIQKNAKPDRFYAGDFEVNRLYESEFVQILLCEADKGGMDTHVHEYSDEYMIILTGQEDVKIDGVKRTVKRGDHLMIRAGEQHKITNIDNIIKICILHPPEAEYKQ